MVVLSGRFSCSVPVVEEGDGLCQHVRTVLQRGGERALALLVHQDLFVMPYRHPHQTLSQLITVQRREKRREKKVKRKKRRKRRKRREKRREE